MSGKVEAGADVVFLNGKTENFPVGVQIVPLRIAVSLQHPVETAVGEVQIIHQGAVPVPEDHTVCLHGNLRFLEAVFRKWISALRKQRLILLQRARSGPCCSR